MMRVSIIAQNHKLPIAEHSNKFDAESESPLNADCGKRVGVQPTSAISLKFISRLATAGHSVQLYTAETTTPAELLAGSVPHFAHSDLLIFHVAEHYPLLDVVQSIDRGVVAFHLHASVDEQTDAQLTDVQLTDVQLTNADFLLVDSDAHRDELIGQGWPDDRIYLSERSGFEYFLQAVEAILPKREVDQDDLLGASKLASVDALSDAQLQSDLDQLAAAAQTFRRGYEIRSAIPLVGPIVAWLRRNLTSHLREPYLDPMLQKQESFNQQISHMTRQLADRSATNEALLRRIEDLEAQVAELTKESANT